MGICHSSNRKLSLWLGPGEAGPEMLLSIPEHQLEQLCEKE